ncbi:MAG: hypothetical protein KIC96_15480 [Enterococcus casseliflavus]|uniref:hypothetical protein n=1 Tax=Enterococcus casseliflavus TaxID=37734 RepID=UPI00290A1C5D|nr:hypothetical protein [Enterococcus casseliflavus]MDU3349026.1 hypothetical protein [Clostridium sp.]
MKINDVSTEELIEELSKRQGVILFKECGLYKDYDVSIKEKFNVDRNKKSQSLPETFQTLIIET